MRTTMVLDDELLGKWRSTPVFGEDGYRAGGNEGADRTGERAQTR